MSGNKYITNVIKILRYFKAKLVSYFVAKEEGKGLSKNDFTDELKTKLQSLPDTEDIPVLDNNGLIPLNKIPQAALERVVTVSNQTARYALTINDVQLGDVVKESNTGLMFYVVDTDELDNSSGYEMFAAGTAASAPWEGITDKPSTYPPSSHTHSGSDITSKVGSASVADTASAVEWDNISNKPSTLLHTTDIVDDLVTNNSTKPLSAKQGKSLKDMVDSLSASSVIVDSSMDSSSNNPVRNSVIKSYVDTNTVSAVAEGSTNGTVSVTKNGTSSDVAVHGLGSAAYAASTDYATSNHSHGNILNDGKIGSTANLPLITTANGEITTGSFGNTANSFCEGNDSRLSDSRTPVSHTHAGTDITSKVSSAGTADIATTLGSSTVGASNHPIYLNSGSPSQCVKLDPPPVASTRDYYYAATHNRVNTCKNLLAYYTLDELSTMISAGTFDDIYVGDYIEMEMTSDYDTETVRWIVAAINYFKDRGNPVTTDNHIVLVAEDCFKTKQKMNSSNTAAGGYASSSMYITVLPKYDTAITNAFGASHVLSYVQMLSTSIDSSAQSMAGANFVGCSNNWAWVDGSGSNPHITKLNLMSEPQLYGTTAFSSSIYDISINNSQFPLFAQIPEKIQCGRGFNASENSRLGFWLSAVACYDAFAQCSSGAIANRYGASSLYGVRPYFLFK